MLRIEVWEQMESTATASRGLDSDTWKEKVKHDQRSLVETAMFRIKRLFGKKEFKKSSHEKSME